MPMSDDVFPEELQSEIDETVNSANHEHLIRNESKASRGNILREERVTFDKQDLELRFVFVEVNQYEEERLTPLESAGIDGSVYEAQIS